MKRLGSVLAATTCVVAFAVSGGAQAALFQTAQCTVPVVVGRTGTCSASFEVGEARRPATLGTHVNFHATLAVGNVTMQWIDPDIAEPVAEWRCTATGGYTSVGSVEVGLFDVAAQPGCTQTIRPEAAFARGTQYLIVSGSALSCTTDRPQSSCLLHGALQLEPSFMPAARAG